MEIAVVYRRVPRSARKDVHVRHRTFGMANVAQQL